MKKTLRFVFAFVFIVSFASAQSFEETLTKLAGDAGKGFVQPVVSALGNDMNGGWFHKAPQSKIFGIDFELGLVGMATFTTDENKTFSAQAGFRFSGGQVVAQGDPNFSSRSQAQKIAENMTVNSISFYNLPGNEQQAIIDAISNSQFQVGLTGPTVVGSKQDTMKITIPSTTVTYTSPTTNISTTQTIPGSELTLDGVTGVLDGSATVPLAAPQLTLGTIYGTQATFRWLPEVTAGDLGKVKYFGFGLQHNLGMWLPIPVVDVAASFFTQKLNVGTTMEAKTTSFGLNASKQFGFAFLNVTPYAGFMIESSKMTFGYDYTYTVGATNQVVTDRIAFELDGENKTRLTLGLSIRLLIVNINADYNIGKQNSATAGVFFAF